MKQRIHLFYLTHLNFGGWATYTAHLTLALEQVLGAENVHLWKIGNKSEHWSRPFGYSVNYRNITPEDALALVHKGEPVLIVALARQRFDVGLPMLQAGARIVIHDCDEMKNELKDTLESVKKRIITIRDNTLVKSHGALYIPHPYVPQGDGSPSTRKVHAISTCRIDFDKHTEWLLEANDVLPEAKRIKIYGYENRAYAFRKILPRWTWWKQSKAHYPREIDYAYRLLHEATYMIDMSHIKNDGGGTQYSFLEAIDAGAVCVLNDAWFGRKGEMVAGKNCLSVRDSRELTVLLKVKPNPATLAQVSTAARKILKAHQPILIGDKYAAEVC